jgi:membrane fusion protein, multidrug efflux system
MKLTPKRGLLLAIIVLASIAPLVMTVRSKPKLQVQAAVPGVEVVQVIQKDVPVYREWIGTLDGMVNAEIKAQVTGYLMKQVYTEGSLVKEGQPLFEIDPRPFLAALDQAKATLAQAEGRLAEANGQLLEAQAQVLRSEANQGRTQLDVNRYIPLAKAGGVTEQDLDNAVQANLAAKAELEAAKAKVETGKAAIVSAKAAMAAGRAAVVTAELNLGFTKIVSPIAGIAGIANAQIGNLVNAGGDRLTTVSTMDPIKVYFTASEQAYLRYLRANPNLRTETELQAHIRQFDLELVLADGNVYPRRGRILFADREVDPKIGAIRLAGVFPNPANELRPGQYGRVRAITEIRKNALLVPQRAVIELQGSYQVAVVGSGNKVSFRPVKVGVRSGSMWVIEDGLKPGETVVAEGLQRVRPNVVVNPKPFVSPPPSPPLQESAKP